jgi:hypothetical protein
MLHVALIRERHGQHNPLSVAAVKVDPVTLLLGGCCALARSEQITPCLRRAAASSKGIWQMCQSFSWVCNRAQTMAISFMPVLIVNLTT